MLLKQSTLRDIKAGTVTVQFRRWKRPTVKAGGTLLTAAGQLSVESVDVVERGEITEDEARAAGFPTLESLLETLDASKSGRIYRVGLSYLGADPRIALRSALPDASELEDILARLARFDTRSSVGPWTAATLRTIRERPEQRAAELASALGMDRAHFKTQVRKLKGLGLTESLEIGYRLSPRGVAVLSHLIGPTNAD